jgi:hypothetical protein
MRFEVLTTVKMFLFVCRLKAHQLLRLFVPIYYSRKIKSDSFTKASMFFLHAKEHKEGHITKNKNKSNITVMRGNAV